MDRGAQRATVHKVAKLGTTEATQHVCTQGVDVDGITPGERLQENSRKYSHFWNYEGGSIKKKKKNKRLKCLELSYPKYVAQYNIGEGSGTPLQYSCLENPMDGGAWWAAVHGVAESRTRLSNFTFTFHFHALEKEMATHFSVFPGESQRQGEPGGLPSMWSHRVGQD